jgi:hypothetical protein
MSFVCFTTFNLLAYVTNEKSFNYRGLIMQKFIVYLFTIIVLLFISSPALSASSEVKWVNPDDYTDIRSGNLNRKKFKEQVFSQFEKHFEKLATKLPEGQKLKIEVHNLDLAGDVNAGGMERIRIVKEVYSPKMKFSYQLVGDNDTKISAGEANLKDMNFMGGTSMKYKHHSFGYEMKMLDHWFKETFE